VDSSFNRSQLMASTAPASDLCHNSVTQLGGEPLPCSAAADSTAGSNSTTYQSSREANGSITSSSSRRSKLTKSLRLSKLSSVGIRSSTPSPASPSFVAAVAAGGGVAAA